MKCDLCPSDFVRKETYKSHIISHHKRQISDQQFEEILEKIRKFQPPSLDVTKYTLEKQTNEVGEIIDEVEMIEEDEIQGDDSETYYEETEIFEDEQ